MSRSKLLVSSVLFACLLCLACDDEPAKGGDGGSADAGTLDGAAPGAVCRQDADCDDGLYCTGTETCNAGQCEAGTPVACDDGIACTVDTCSERTQDCSSAAPDSDGDGHGAAGCEDGKGVALGDDCDDEDPLRFPGNIESCDPGNKDDDCDPKTFGNKDSDDDGFYDAKCCNAASDAPGAKLVCGDDCDDLKASVNAKGTEACDLFDNDCDGKTDEGVAVEQFADADYDGHGATGAKAVMKCAGSVGFAPVANDCDDKDDERFPGQFEICDGKDNNCKDGADELQQDAPWFVDADQDGFGDAAGTPVYSCERIPGRELSHNDCNDAAPAVNPAAAELCDALDNDCSGARDFRIDVNDFEDDDNDGIADAKCKPAGKDCDDTDATTGNGKEEVCDTRDNDCDDAIDEDTAQTVWYLDKDGDGWGTDVGTALARCEPIPGRAANLGDCDDSVNAVHPGALERCNGDDDNCNDKLDEGADYQCKLDNAVAFCKTGSCSVLSCYPGFDDCDQSAANGCECTVPIVATCTACCVIDGDCDNGDYCDGKERCIGGDCFDGTPINCSASQTVLQGSFFINNSLDIQMLAGIETITGDLSIGAPGLVNLTGLEALKTVGGKLIVDGDLDGDGNIDTNKSLVALVGSGLSNLISVGGDVVIEDNPALVTIRLPSLVTAANIYIRRNAALTTLDGFGSLATVGGTIEVSSNGALTTFPGMQLLGSATNLTVIGNALTALSLPGLTVLHGTLDLASGYRQASDTTLATISFAKLKTVEGSVLIDGLSALTTLSLPALTSVLGLSFRIGNCPLLDDPDLHSFASFGATYNSSQEQYPTLDISNNAALQTLSKVRAVDCISGSCYTYISSNPLLDTCDAVAWLTTFTSNWFGRYAYSNDTTTCADTYL